MTPFINCVLFWPLEHFKTKIYPDGYNFPFYFAYFSQMSIFMYLRCLVFHCKPNCDPYNFQKKLWAVNYSWHHEMPQFPCFYSRSFAPSANKPFLRHRVFHISHTRPFKNRRFLFTVSTLLLGGREHNARRFVVVHSAGQVIISLFESHAFCRWRAARRWSNKEISVWNVAIKRRQRRRV